MPLWHAMPRSSVEFHRNIICPHDSTEGMAIFPFFGSKDTLLALDVRNRAIRPSDCSVSGSLENGIAWVVGVFPSRASGVNVSPKRQFEDRLESRNTRC